MNAILRTIRARLTTFFPRPAQASGSYEPQPQEPTSASETPAAEIVSLGRCLGDRTVRGYYASHAWKVQVGRNGRPDIFCQECLRNLFEARELPARPWANEA